MRAPLLGLLWGLHLAGRAATAPADQRLLILPPADSGHLHEKSKEPPNKLHGRFLHITGTKGFTMAGVIFVKFLANEVTDFHPDPFYEAYTSTEAEQACHRGRGPAGKFGAETTDCDSPLSLINATFHWIDKHLKDSIDFIVWTGDSARHDNDEYIPRTEKQVVELNKMMVEKYFEIFGKENYDDDPTNDFSIPIIPNFGNNDVLPHNIFNPGPNRWTRKYLNIWRRLIPEEQRHVFERGGYFFVEAIPDKLAIFSLNTLYFFDSNTAVDGCAKKSEPGYEQMDWLRIQLQLMRARGMKAILTGHVPPARTEAKISWDETCWHKYTLWLRQYRDVIVGSLYGHMNIEHFMLQDAHQIDDGVMNGEVETLGMTTLDDEFSIQSAAEYLVDLRNTWRKLPDSGDIELDTAENRNGDVDLQASKRRKKKPKPTKEEKFFNKIGGEWGERYSLTFVSGSVVPNYFPSLRVYEYNISGIDELGSPAGVITDETTTQHNQAALDPEEEEVPEETTGYTKSKKTKNSKTRPKKPRKPRFKTPLPPSKSSPPGPAYSPQTLSLLGYTQYFANLTTINNDFNSKSQPTLSDAEELPIAQSDYPQADDQGYTEEDNETPSGKENQDLSAKKWHSGKHQGKRPHPKRLHRKFQYEIEYDTRTDEAWNMTDLTVRNYIQLAATMGRYKPKKKHGWWSGFDLGRERVELESRPETEGDVATAIATDKFDKRGKKSEKSSGKRSRKQKKKARRKAVRELWYTFLRRAYIGSMDDEELKEEFGRL